MLETRHLLQRGGWRLTYREPKHKLCSELLPDPGTTIVIGQNAKGKGCTAAWMTREGALRTVNILPKEDHWEARVKHNGRYYVITIGVRGQMEIGGLVKEGKIKAAIRKPPGGGREEAQGTWTAEANPGG